LPGPAATRARAFAEIIKTNMMAVDPECARQAVRTMMWEDPALSLSLAGVTPDVVNYLVEAVLELGRTMNQFPGPLLDAFVDQMVGGIDTARIREVPAVYGPLFEKIDMPGRTRKAFGQAVNAAAQMINRTAAKNPYFLRDAVSEVDGRQVARAALAVGRSALLWGLSATKKLVSTVLGYGMRGDGS
jgi:hypothetical protein